MANGIDDVFQQFRFKPAQPNEVQPAGAQLETDNVFAGEGLSDALARAQLREDLISRRRRSGKLGVAAGAGGAVARDALAALLACRDGRPTAMDQIAEVAWQPAEEDKHGPQAGPGEGQATLAAIDEPGQGGREEDADPALRQVVRAMSEEREGDDEQRRGGGQGEEAQRPHRYLPFTPISAK